MDFSNKWPEIQHQQTHPASQIYNAFPSYPNSTLKDLHTNPIQATHLPLPATAHFDSTGLRLPAIDSYASNHGLPHAGYDAPMQPMPTAPANSQQGWALKDAIRPFGVDPFSYGAAGGPPNAVEPMVRTNTNPLLGLHHFANSAMYRRPKKTNVVQSVWCEVCKIDCNSKDVLDKHKLGKKHKKNVQKLEESKKEANAAAAPTASFVKPIIQVVGKKEASSNREKNVAMQVAKRKGAPPVEAGDDLETKRRKLMEGGAPVESVRVCVVCNVACNSETVFNYHMAGQKHATKARKQASMAMAITAAAGSSFVAAM